MNPDTSNQNAQLVTPPPLTPKEKQILEYIESYIEENSFSPSYQEIKEYFGFASFYSIQRYLKQLSEKNYIQTEGGNKKRSIQIVNTSDSQLNSLMNKKSKNKLESDFLQIPILGSVAAGLPIEKQEFDEYLNLPTDSLKNPKNCFALRVEGESMIEEGIFDGDLLIAESLKHAENGQLIIACIEEEATVKRFFKHKNNSLHKQVELRPSNSSMSSLFYHPSKVEIRGKVVKLLRDY